jgi:phosphatidyl-myo-inositol dimannoside synthase
MKLLILTTDFPPFIGGVSTFTFNIATGLQQAGCRVKIVTSVGSDRSENHTNLAVIHMPAMLNRQVLKAVPLLGSALFICRSEPPDKILAMQWTHEGTVAWAIRRLLGIPYAVVTHGSEIVAARRQSIRRALMMHVLHNAESVIANSNFTRRLVMDLGLSPSRVAVVSPPARLSAPSEPAAIAVLDEKLGLAGKRVILTAARMVRRKGHAEVIQALACLHDHYQDLVYVMTGQGEYRGQLEALAEQCGVADRIRFVGFVSASELAQLYQRADIYVSPSCQDGDDIEGFGISLTEAASYGKPVIAGRSGGVDEAIKNGVTGLLVNPGQTVEVVEAMTRLLDNPSLRRRMGESGRDWVNERFSVYRQGERLKNLLSEGSAS